MGYFCAFFRWKGSEEMIEFSTRIYLEEEAKEYLRQMKNEKIMVITDSFMASAGSFQGLMGLIADKNEYKIYSDIVPDPPIDNLLPGIKIIVDFKPTQIIAFGGGSPIDAAKGIKYFSMKTEGVSNIPFIAIPTTSGTGSEVTNFSVITDAEKGQKYPLVTPEIQPDVALLITDYVLSVPNKVTADTGMDVLTHAIEAYVSTKHTLFSDSYCEKVVKTVFNELENCYRNGNDFTSRKKMHEASCMAGMAFNLTSLGLNHGIAHALGGKYHIAHGRLNAILLPHVIAYNSGIDEISSEYNDEIAMRYAKLATLITNEMYSPRAGVRALIQLINKLNKQLNIPNYVEGIELEIVKKELQQTSLGAMNDRCTPTNPIEPKIEEIEKLIVKLFK